MTVQQARASADVDAGREAARARIEQERQEMRPERPDV
jgi:hypothetical protein